MKRLSITHAQIPGHVLITYNDDDILQAIDFSECELPPENIQKIINWTPVDYRNKSMFPKSLKIVEVAIEISFDDYWRPVRKKVNKARCIPIFEKLSPAIRLKVVSSYKEYIKCCIRTGRKEADPETFLKQEYYNTEWKTIN